MRELVDLAARLAEVERKLSNQFRHGTVAQVDPQKQVVRMRLGGTDDKPFLGPWVPYGQIAGALKLHTPPSVGQQMTMLSPNGDFRQAVAVPLTWSNQNASPSTKGDEHVLTFGSVKVTMKSEQVLIEVGGAKLDIKAEKIVADVGGKKLIVAGDGVRTVKETYLGLDDDDEKPLIKVVTLGGPAKQAFSKT